MKFDSASDYREIAKLLQDAANAALNVANAVDDEKSEIDVEAAVKDLMCCMVKLQTM